MNIKKRIMAATGYRDTEPFVKEISASQLGSDILQIFLRYKYGVPKETEPSVSTMGSLLHLGMEKVLEDIEDVDTEVHFEKDIDGTEWKLTGTIDAFDRRCNTIYDWKMVKKYRVQKLEKELETDPYTLQLNAYRILTGTNPVMKIVTFSCDAGYDFKTGSVIPVMKVIDVPEIPDELMMQMIKDKVDAVEEHIKNGTTPERCADVWLRKTKNGTVPIRCEQYCSYKKVCKRYNPKPEKVVASWGY